MVVIVCVPILFFAAVGQAFGASDYHGRVITGVVPVPGATVTAIQGNTTIRTITDEAGVYRFSGLAEGAWTVIVEMVGFEPLTFEVTIPPPATNAPETSLLRLLPVEKFVREGRDVPLAEPTQAISTATAVPEAGFRRVGVDQVPSALPASTEPSGNVPLDATGIGAAAGLLINGSVNNGASTAFAQARSFGTNRPGQPSAYTGAFGLRLGRSAWDARTHSLTGERPPKPSYTDTHVLGTFQGPFSLPRVRNRLNVFVGYQGTNDHNAITQSIGMPTALERAGDFSQSFDGAGRPVTIIDPSTGQPFPNNRIPIDRISRQAAALLGYYPVVDSVGQGRFNYQAPIISGTRQDSAQARLNQSLNARNQLQATIGYQRSQIDSTNLFGFDNARKNSGLDVQANWTYRWSQFMSLRARYQFTHQSDATLPYFANRTNISGDAGIAGNAQDPLNWGPPTLQFASDMAGLNDARYAETRNVTHTWAGEGLSFHGRHSVTVGGEVRDHNIDIFAQQDPRGTFTFTGARTGSDFADFLLGLPQTSSIAFGNPDKYFRNKSYAAYFSDDWRFSPSVTVNVGLRWEYEAPITERMGRLVNLDVADGFTAVAPVVASDGVGMVTGARYPESLLHPDRSGIQPRIGLAWRPLPASSLIVRAGYGIYRNQNVYPSIATLLAQQPPLSTTFSVETSAANPLTLANGFTIVSPVNAINTFAVDPNFKVGFAQNWQASLQRDLPHSLTIVVTYLGVKGSRLMQQFLPNTYPAGAATTCASCPVGFRYLTSGGRSIRNAAQLQLRRRLRNGLAASVQYTLAKAMDNAAAFAGASLDGVALAQNWLDLEAEYARSNFDQRHQVTAQFEYTTGAGVGGGTLLDGWRGRLFKDWTITSQLTAGTGLPLTPLYFAPVRGTGIIGATRPSLTGQPLEGRAGYYANRAAFAPTAAGEWGTAARNSITGPRQFSLNASVARTFRLGDRLNLDWRIEATNVLNQVTYASVNTLITSPQFGLPNRTNDMRKVHSSLRVRF